MHRAHKFTILFAFNSQRVTPRQAMQKNIKVFGFIELCRKGLDSFHHVKLDKWS